MFNLSDVNIVGKTFNASIGEPWDFCSSAGDGCLKGKILSVNRSLSRKDQWLIHCSVSEFERNNRIINSIILANRYMGSQDVLQLLSEKQSTHFNMFFLTDRAITDEEDIAKLMESNESKTFLIGSVKLS
jgi:hypothetical protein